ncbi:neuronal acetylcholine receptor subunit alpha-5-like [Glandiceps talaboti]
MAALCHCIDECLRLFSCSPILQKWKDLRLQWDPEKYNGTHTVRIPVDGIWKPDIYCMNSIVATERKFPVNVILSNDGHVDFEDPYLLMTSCQMDMTFFPYDIHVCEIKFGSWSYTTDALVLVMEDDIGLHDYVDNGGWRLLKVSTKLSSHTTIPEGYDGVNITFSDAAFKFAFERKSSFFTVNFIAPSVIISLLTLVVFLLPTDTEERVSICITIALGLVVFILVLVSVIPSTAQFTIIGNYLLFSVTVTFASTATNATIFSLTKKSSDVNTLKPWIRKLFLLYLPTILCMKRPHFSPVHSSRVNSDTELTSFAGNKITCENRNKHCTRLLNENEENDKINSPPIKRSKRNVVSEWIFISHVVDRLSLICFVIMYIVGIPTILLNLGKLHNQHDE